MLKESIHGHPSKEDSRMKIRPHALITNIGEHPTTIFEVQFYGVSLLNEIVQGGALFELKSPIRINGKDTIHFKEEIFVAGLFPKNDCILNMTVFFAGGTATSNKTVSTYHEILPLRFTEHKKPAI